MYDEEDKSKLVSIFEKLMKRLIFKYDINYKIKDFTSVKQYDGSCNTIHSFYYSQKAVIEIKKIRKVIKNHFYF